jgi:hypothetical protein
MVSSPCQMPLIGYRLRRRVHMGLLVGDTFVPLPFRRSERE